MQDPNRETLDNVIDEMVPDVDRWTREETIYWFAYEYHSGQGSNLYSVLGTSPFDPGPMANGPSEWESSDLLQRLVEHFGK
jgi:hypothetical protein